MSATGSRSSDSTGMNRYRVNYRRPEVPWFRGPKVDYKEIERLCWCRHPITAVMWCSWSIDNPGRRFFVCQKEHNEQCKYFEWFDVPLCGRAIDLINGLKNERIFFRNELRRYIAYECDYCRTRTLMQQETINSLQVEVDGKTLLLSQLKKKCVMFKITLLMSWVFFGLVMVMMHTY